MAPTTRCTPVVGKSDDNASEITLADVMHSLNTIIANQTVHIDKISDLDKQITAIENVVFTDEKKDVRKAPTSRTSHDEPSSRSIEPAQRDPLTMPGMPGSTFTNFRTFMAPDGSTGPRGPNNLLILSEPHVDRESRKSWLAHNLNSAYIQWLWSYWCELIAESDLLISHLDSRNGNKPFRSGLRPINKTRDIENLSLLYQIQAALVQEDVDSSDRYTGGVLMQPDAPLSPQIRATILQRTMDGAYLRLEREALDIIQALQTWQDWIEGCDIIIRTDHERLASIRKKPNLPPRMQRFVDVIKHFDPTIIWKRGKSNQLADWLSGPPSNVSTFPIAGYDPVHENTQTTLPSTEPPDPERLNWIDLQAIVEYLQHNIPLC
ncbi:hypothetical protein K3495_g2512 [Podosphaera aphanis]|nr:hypothetical protein K3495_g2512 [Podosphaera aphanis]